MSVAAPTTATLRVSCRDRTGLVAALSQFVFDYGGNILDADQHADLETGLFFMRLVFSLESFKLDRAAMQGALAMLATRFDLTWELTTSDVRPRVAVLASKTPHCLYDLLLSHQLDQDLSYIRIGKDEGAKLALGGDLVSRATPGFYMNPALFVDVDNAMRVAREEIFGPVTAMIPARDYEHALALANDTEFGLCAGICTTSLKYASHFKRNIEAGMAMVNVPTAGVDYHVPFGGRKGSSFGSREQGRYAAEFYTTVKTAYTLA